MGTRGWGGLAQRLERADSAAEYGVDAGKNELEPATRDLADAITEDLFIQRGHQRDVRNGVLSQTRFLGAKQDVSGGIRPSEIAGKRDTDHGSDLTSVDRIALRYHDRTSVSGFGAGGFFEIGPPDISLLDYHSTRRSTCRAARLLKASAFSPMDDMASFICSVTRSGA